MCLSSMPVRIEMVNTNGIAIRLQLGPGPYGYSDYSSGSSLRFQAAGGSVLALKITNVELRPVLAGNVIVVAAMAENEGQTRWCGVGMRTEGSF